MLFVAIRFRAYLELKFTWIHLKLKSASFLAWNFGYINALVTLYFDYNRLICYNSIQFLKSCFIIFATCSFDEDWIVRVVVENAYCSENTYLYNYYKYEIRKYYKQLHIVINLSQEMAAGNIHIKNIAEFTLESALKANITNGKILIFHLNLVRPYCCLLLLFICLITDYSRKN